MSPNPLIYLSTDDLQNFQATGFIPWNDVEYSVEGAVIAVDMMGIIHAVGIEIPPSTGCNYICKIYYAYSFDDGINWLPDPDDPEGDGNPWVEVADDARARVAPFISINVMNEPVIIYYGNDDKYKLVRTYNHGLVWETPEDIVYI